MLIADEAHDEDMNRAASRLGVSLAAVSLLMGCGVGDDRLTTEPTSESNPGITESAGSPTRQPTTPGQTEPEGGAAAPRSRPAAPEQPAIQTDVDTRVNVYWGWSIDSIVAGTPERIAAGGRTVQAPSATPPLEATMAALLDGPDSLELEIGMTTLVPSATALLGVELADGVATVDLSGAFNESGGTLGETMRIAQVVFTLTQFDEVTSVDFRIDGMDVDTLGTHGFEVLEPLDRDDFGAQDVRPFILVETPTPGETLDRGDRLAGESNTFEATVEYVIVDNDGAIIGEGFTTATAGTGTWGEFDVEVTYEDTLDDRGAIIVFETSPRDGSQTNVVEYPVALVPRGDVDLPATE